LNNVIKLTKEFQEKFEKALDKRKKCAAKP